MSLNYRQQRQLHRIESRLLRSDPYLAAALTVFGRLSADERMPVGEQLTTRLERTRQAAIPIAKPIAAVAATIGLLVSAVLALLTGLVTGSPARPPQPTRQQAGPGSNLR
jgi:uncharacterized oligopeptide transporter (OPT) family protein